MTSDALRSGDIYLADLDPVGGSEQAGRRPVIVISSDLFHSKSKRVIVCPITSNMRPWNTKISLPDGLKTKGMVLTDQIRSVDKRERLLRRIEATSDDYLVLVRSYVGRLIDLEVSP